MKNISIDTSGKIDSSYIYAIKEIKKITDSQKIPFFIIGAFARDIIMEYCYGIKAPRRTMDIDLGIQVSNWDKFNKLTDSLKKSGKFETLNEKQRIIYKDIIIDIIPFGDISDKNERIIWPSDDIILSVLGFTEVYQNSTLVRLSNKPKLEVKIPTLPGLSNLKVTSVER